METQIPNSLIKNESKALNITSNVFYAISQIIFVIIFIRYILITKNTTLPKDMQLTEVNAFQYKLKSDYMLKENFCFPVDILFPNGTVILANTIIMKGSIVPDMQCNLYFTILQDIQIQAGELWNIEVLSGKFIVDEVEVELESVPMGEDHKLTKDITIKSGTIYLMNGMITGSKSKENDIHLPCNAMLIKDETLKAGVTFGVGTTFKAGIIFKKDTVNMVTCCKYILYLSIACVILLLKFITIGPKMVWKIATIALTILNILLIIFSKFNPENLGIYEAISIIVSSISSIAMIVIVFFYYVKQNKTLRSYSGNYFVISSAILIVFLCIWSIFVMFLKNQVKKN